MRFNWTRLIEFAVLALCLAGICAASLQEPEALSYTIKLTNANIAAMKTAKGVVTIDIPPGLHAYQNPPEHDYEIPLKLESETKGIVIKPSYPKGTSIEFAGTATKAYEGSVSIPFTFTAPKKLGPGVLKLRLTYQLCNDSNCWPPASVSKTVKYKVVKPASRK